MSTTPSPQRRLLERIAEQKARERLEPPWPAARVLASKHVRSEHGYRSFRLERDVYLGGDRTDSQVLMWDPTRALFHCKLCGKRFGTGEITDAMAQRALMFDAGTQAAVAGLVGPDRLEMAKRVLSGERAAERLRAAREADPPQKGPSPDRPTVQEAHERVQAWLSEKIAELGTLRAALDEAERVQLKDPDDWRRANLKFYARETLEDIWEELHPALREEAYDEYRRRQEDAAGDGI